MSYTFTKLCSKITTVTKLYRSNYIFKQLKAFFFVCLVFFCFPERVAVRSLKALFCSISVHLFPRVCQSAQQHKWCWNLFRSLSCYSGRASATMNNWRATNKRLCVCMLHLNSCKKLPCHSNAAFQTFSNTDAIVRNSKIFWSLLFFIKLRVYNSPLLPKDCCS